MPLRLLRWGQQSVQLLQTRVIVWEVQLVVPLAVLQQVPLSESPVFREWLLLALVVSALQPGTWL
jgi:hypothetical protein